jgi:hypothetical protein
VLSIIRLLTRAHAALNVWFLGHSAYHHQDSAAVIEEGEEDELPKRPGSAKTLYHHGHHLLPAALQPTSQPHVKMRKLSRVSPQVGCHLANISAE